MNGIVANLIVGFAIATSACYCVWRLGPRSMREALRRQLSKRLPLVFPAAAAARGGCDACQGCTLGTRAAHPSLRRANNLWD